MEKTTEFLDLNSVLDTSKIITNISSKLSKILSEDIEELNVSSYLFRDGLQSSLEFVFESILSKSESVLVFTDTVPGFTITVFKKKSFNYNYSDNISYKNKNSLIKNSEDNALQIVLDSFIKKSEPNILVIELKDLFITLFPLSESKKNLKELGLYITF